MVNLCGRSSIARAKRIVSPSGTWRDLVFDSVLPTAVPQTAHCDSPPPIMEPQFRHIVGRGVSESFGDWSDKIMKALHTNKRDAFITKSITPWF
jgi:hypothetical protein